MKAVITVKKSGTALGGTLAAEGFPVMPLSAVTPSDTGVLMVADTPDGGVSVKIKFVDAERISGSLNYQGMEMPISGTFAVEGGAAGAITNAAGTYVFVTSEPLMGIAKFDARCVVTRSDAGVYGGTCGNPENGEVPIGAVAVAGNVVTISGDTPGGPFKVVMTVAGTAFDGMISLGNETAKFSKGTYTAAAR